MSRGKSTSRGRGLRLVFVVTALVAGAIGFWMVDRYLRFGDEPVQGIEAGASLLVERGDNFADVLRKLHAQGMPSVRDPEWQLLSRQLGAAGRLQVGEYALRQGITPRQLLMDMRNGKVISRRFTIVEGWSLRQVRAALARAEPLQHETAKLDDAAIHLQRPDWNSDCRVLAWSRRTA